ncbi:MAG: HAD family hydrolase [Acidobacteria bacterium]|nr:HAD family hydrolase [Acidobacteriota bacterium]
MIRAAIFDLDGTLVDSVDLHARAWQEAFRHFGREVAFERVREQIGKGGDQLLPVFFSRQELQRFGKELEDYRDKRFKENYLPQVKAFPQVRDLFERLLADGKRLALASSAQGDELQTYKRLARIEDLITGESSADEVEKSKPHPDVFAVALATLDDIEAHEAMVVGDTPYDAEAANKLGLQTIGVLCGGFPETDLRAAGCLAIYQNPADLLANLAHSPLGEVAWPQLHDASE